MAATPYLNQDLLEQADQIGIPLAVRRKVGLYEQACWIAIRQIIMVQGEAFDVEQIAAEIPTQSLRCIKTWIENLIEAGLLERGPEVFIPGKRIPRTQLTIPFHAIMQASIELAKTELTTKGGRYRISSPVEHDPRLMDQLMLDLGEITPSQPLPLLDEPEFRAIQDIFNHMVEVRIPLVVRRSVGIPEQICWLAINALIERGITAFGVRDIAREIPTGSNTRVARWVETLIKAKLISVVGSEKIPNCADRRIFAIPWEDLLRESLLIAKTEQEDRLLARGNLANLRQPGGLTLLGAAQGAQGSPPSVIHVQAQAAERPQEAAQGAQGATPPVIHVQAQAAERPQEAAQGAQGAPPPVIHVPLEAAERVEEVAQGSQEATQGSQGAPHGVQGAAQGSRGAPPPVIHVPLEAAERAEEVAQGSQGATHGVQEAPPPVSHVPLEATHGIQGAPPPVIYVPLEAAGRAEEAAQGSQKTTHGIQGAPPPVIHVLLQAAERSQEAAHGIQEVPSSVSHVHAEAAHGIQTAAHGIQEIPSSVSHVHAEATHGIQEAAHGIQEIPSEATHGSQEAPNFAQTSENPVSHVHVKAAHGIRCGSVGLYVSRWEGNAPSRVLENHDPLPPPASPDQGIFAMHPKWVWRGDLFAHPLEIWNHVGREPQASDVYVLYAIASQHDLYTDGHGWYWVGQAMLKVAASGKKISVPRLVKILMDDWHDNDNYGDDSDQRQREPLLLGNGQPRAAFEKTLDLSLRPEALETDSAPMTNGATEETSPGEATAAPRSHETNSNGSEHRAQRNGAAEHTTRPSPAPRDSSKLLAHPACQAYLEAFDTTLNLEQINRITETVHDLVLWRKVLADWQANGWREQSVLKMLDRYTKEVDAANPHEDMESIIWIQCHPDLDIDERVKWSHRFRAATASSERRAIIAELLKKHPTRREDLLL